MSKRGLNIYKRKDGRWEGRVKRELREGYYSIYGKTYKEVKIKMEKYIQTNQENQSNGGECNMTITELVELWLEEKRTFWKPATYATYRQLSQKHIIPDIGHVKAKQFGTQALTEYINYKKSRNDGKDFSDLYLKNICAVILQAYSHYNKKNKYILFIPQKPYIKTKNTKKILPDECYLQQLEQYLRMKQDDSSYLGILLAYYTGIRIGELCALRWKDIDFISGTLHIEKTMQRIKQYDSAAKETKIVVQEPKTEHSRREIPLPEELIAILKKQVKPEHHYIIGGKKNPWAEPRTIQYRFQKILKECNIPYFNFHLLRHAFATRCIQSGFDVKSLSEILGHSNIQITLNLYVHSSMQHKRSLMNMLMKNVS